MASFSTVITAFSESENRKTFMVTGHTVQAPKLIIQKRKVPSTQSANQESDLMVVYGTTDPASIPLSQKVVFSANVRYPANGNSSHVTAALAVFRDFVASDQFGAMVTSQAYVA